MSRYTCIRLVDLPSRERHIILAMLLLLLLAVARPAQAIEKASEQVSAFYGIFSQAVPIEVPGFRGLEPRIGRSYCESLFTLDCEVLDFRPFHSQAEARIALFDFIEGWYNPQRRHSALAYHSPLIFERLYASPTQ